jgi:hypothetical protein
LSKNHSVYKDFQNRNGTENIEKNIFYSDLTLTTNTKLTEVVLEKFKELSESKFKDEESYVSIGTLPLLVDTEIIMENIETTFPQLTLEEQNPLRVGIVATNYTWEDLTSYKEQFNKIQNELGDKVKHLFQETKKELNHIVHEKDLSRVKKIVDRERKDIELFIEKQASKPKKTTEQFFIERDCKSRMKIHSMQIFF